MIASHEDGLLAVSEECFISFRIDSQSVCSKYDQCRGLKCNSRGNAFNNPVA